MDLRRNPLPTARCRLFTPPLALLAFLLMGLIAIPGCSGCWGGKTTADAKKKKEDEEKEAEKKKKKKLEKPKDDFEPIAVRMPCPAEDAVWMGQLAQDVSGLDFENQRVGFAA